MCRYVDESDEPEQILRVLQTYSRTFDTSGKVMVIGQRWTDVIREGKRKLQSTDGVVKVSAASLLPMRESRAERERRRQFVTADLQPQKSC